MSWWRLILTDPKHEPPMLGQLGANASPRARKGWRCIGFVRIRDTADGLRQYRVRTEPVPIAEARAASDCYYTVAERPQR